MIGVPTFYNLAFVSTDNVGEQDAEVLVQLKKKHRPSQEYMARIRRELAAKFPDVQTYFMPADVVTQVLNFGVSSMIDVQIEGKDPDAIYGIARDAGRADPQGAGDGGRPHQPGVRPPGPAARDRSPAGHAAATSDFATSRAAC